MKVGRFVRVFAGSGAFVLVACASDPGSTIAPRDSLAAPSFVNDVAPIFRASCSLASCHGRSDASHGIFLGTDPKRMYAELQKTSAIAAGTKFVVPGDPSKSYLVAKLEGTQKSYSAICANGDCGTMMAPGAPLSRTELAIVRTWIEQGALEN